ncbi:MAG: serine/threonine-protein kinase, partial [Polyangiaceae bacterium]
MSDSNPTLASGDAAAADANASASKVGTWIKEKYRLDSIIGDGGMAIVYAATHRNKKRFAVKMLRAEISTIDEIRTRFLREGYVANTVDHPGVVAVLDDDVTADGCAFLVMELLDGSSLEDLSMRSVDGKLPLRLVLAVMHQLLDVLVAAHAKNVVHRDLKPANLFVTKAGQAKVLDFGIARIREANLTNATQTGQAMGTPAFMAPEQARGKASLIGPRTDLYSVGATMYALLSGADVHKGETAQDVVFQAGSTHAPSLAILLPEAPAAVVAIVDRALAFDVEK